MPTYYQQHLPGVEVPEIPVKVLTEEEETQLIDAVRQGYPRDYVMILTALMTGLRSAELVHLTVECVAPYGEVSTVIDLPGKIAKGGRGRSVPIHPDLRDTLKEFLAWKHNRDESTEPSAPLFVTRSTGKNISVRDFQRILRKASIPALGHPVHPHMLRHTFATRVLAKSNTRIVQKLLGHANIQSTQIYTHPTSSDLDAAVRNM